MAFTDLFRPKWQHSNYDVRARAVEKITNPALLAKIAKSDRKDNIPQKAAAKVTDQTSLAEIAQNARSMYARLAAADKLDRRELAQAVYAEAARNPEYHFLAKDTIRKIADVQLAESINAEIASNVKFPGDCRKDAADRLTDRELAQRVYGEIARNAEFLGQWRKDAADKLADRQLAQRVYGEIVMRITGSGDYMLRLDLVRKLTDQSLLAKIAKNDNHEWVRVAAIEKLDDLTLLAYMAKSDQDFSVQACAENRLSALVLAIADQAALAELAKIHENSTVRKNAASKLTDQAELAIIAKTDKDSKVRAAAVANLTDQAELAIIAKTDRDCAVFEAAIAKLSIPTVIAELAMKYDYSGRQEAAVARLTDQTLLAEIMRDTEQPSVYVAAADRLADQNSAQKLIAEIALMAKHPDPVSAGKWKSWMISTQEICQEEFGDKNFAICQVGISAVEKLTDISILAEIANNATESKLRSAAAEQFTIQSAKVAKGTKLPYVRKPKELLEAKSFDELVEMLVGIGKSDGFLSLSVGGVFDKNSRNIDAIQIGERLNETGGIDLMRAACSAISRRMSSIKARELEAAWNGIGAWH